MAQETGIVLIGRCCFRHLFLPGMKGRKQFFFVKKNQKTFINLVLALPHRRRHRSKSFFCSFLQERTAFFSRPRPFPDPDAGVDIP
jgi:hypothetical protein